MKRRFPSYGSVPALQASPFVLHAGIFSLCEQQLVNSPLVVTGCHCRLLLPLHHPLHALISGEETWQLWKLFNFVVYLLLLEKVYHTAVFPTIVAISEFKQGTGEKRTCLSSTKPGKLLFLFDQSEKLFGKCTPPGRGDHYLHTDVGWLCLDV